MTTGMSMLSVAYRFREDGPVSDWERLGQYVVNRRVELGYRQRKPFADALGISLRTLSDIEKGRRGNYDPVTLASLEHVLQWEAGSAMRIADGGEPGRRTSVRINEKLKLEASATASVISPMDDEAIVRVMASSLSDDRKRALVKLLIEEREAAAQQRVQRAEEIINLFENE